MSCLTVVAGRCRGGFCLKTETGEPLSMLFPANGFADENMSRLPPVLLETFWTSEEPAKKAAELTNLVYEELMRLAYPEGN